MDEYAAVVRKFYEVYRPIGRRYNLRVHSRFSMNSPDSSRFIRETVPIGNRSSKSKRTMTLLATRERLMNWKAGRGAGKTKTRDTEQHETKRLRFSVRKMPLQPLCKQRGNDRQLYRRSKRTLLRLR